MQLEFPLQAPESPDAQDVATLSRWLYEAGDSWHTARSISAALDLSDRQIRHLAASSGGLIVSGPGCPGYRHARHCDPEEIQAVCARLMSQAKIMSDRAGTIRACYHRLA